MLREFGSKIFYYTQKILNKINKDYILFSSENPLDHIIENIFVGDLRAADNKGLLKQNGITHIINCADNIALVFPQDFTYSHLKLKDDIYQDLSEALKISIEFILSNSNNPSSKILIHCLKGASRSGAILIAYLIKIKKMKYEDAIEFAKSKRKVIKPNKNFEEQLKLLEENI